MDRNRHKDFIGKEPRYSTHTLSNGLRVVCCHTDSEVVCLGYAVKAGARQEGKDEEGLAHFCEHMTFKGTERLSPLKVITSIERYGGELNAYTGKEETVYYATILSRHFFKAVDTLTEIVFHSTYPQHEIDKEVEVVCDEIESYKDSPAELIYDDFENRMFASTSLGHNILGEAERVRLFTTADCQRFTRRWYRPDNMVFYCMGGGIDFDKLVRRLEAPLLLPPTGGGTQRAEELARGCARNAGVGDTMEGCAGDAGAISGNHIPRAEQGAWCTPPVGQNWRGDLGTHQTHVMVGTAITADLDRWRMPLFVTSNMLGGPGMSALFNIALREKRGLVYSVESAMTSYTDTLVWTTYFGCDADDERRCLRLVHSQLAQLARRPLSDTRLRQLKNQLRGQVILASLSQENAAIDMAKQYLHRGSLRSLPLLCHRIDAVTSADIQQLASEVLAPERLCGMVYGES